MSDLLNKIQIWLASFFVAYWKELLIALFALIVLDIVCKLIKKFCHINLTILKIIKFPFKLIWGLLQKQRVSQPKRKTKCRCCYDKRKTERT